MPRYDYECPTCGIIEIIHSIKDPPKRKCPKCGKRKLQRLISSGINIIFKGEGFWRSTDYINQKAKENGLVHSDRRPPRPM